MEATYKTANGRLLVKVEAETQKELFKQLALAQAVFDASDHCTECDSKDIRFVCRQLEKGDYYELKCGACGAAFSFGQHKVGGTLFPKHDPGWHQWQKGGSGSEPDEDTPY